MRMRFCPPLLLAACTAHPFAEPMPLPDQQTDHYVTLKANWEADILFVIDNSHSMSDEQAKLRNNFPVFLQELKRAAGEKMPSVQIGIVSSDVGAGPVGISGGCERVAGDRGALRVKPTCGLDPRARWIVTRDDEVFKNYTGDVGAVFGCLADLGTMGCGFEHQLQATRLALYPQKGINEENQGFVRPSAFLAIILVTDEDDCSGPPDSDLYGQSFPGQAHSLRCSIAGHLCRGQPPQAMDGWNAPMSECRAADGGKLIAIDELVRDIRALKPSPEQIFVSAIYGVPGAGSTYRVGRDMNMALEVAPACGSTMAGTAAAAGLRIKRFVDALGGESFSICDADYSPAMRRIGKKLGEKIVPNYCIAAPVADVRPMETGVQADCQVSDRISSQQEVLIPPCGSGTGACWRLAADATCNESGFKVEIDRKGQPAPTGTVVMKCLTCARPDDPRCQR